MSLKRRNFLKKLALTSATLATVGTVAQKSFAAPAIIKKNNLKWKMTTTWSKNSPGLGTAAKYMAEFINRASDGRLEIKIFDAGDIVSAFDAIDAVSNGTVEMGHGTPYYWKGKIPAAQFLASIPFGMTAQEQNAWLDFGGGQKIAEEIYQHMGCKFFACGNTGTQMGGWYNKEINSIQDFKNLKIRMPGLGGDVLKSAGATVVNIPDGELLTSMQSGNIEAMEWGGPYNDLAFGIHEVAKHYYYPAWHEPATILDCFINIKAWNRLPEDLKSIVILACKATNQHVYNEFTARNARSLQVLKTDHQITPKRFSNETLYALKNVSATVVSDIASQDNLSQKIYDSITKFQSSSSSWLNIAERSFLNTR